MGLIRDSEQKKAWDEMFISANVIEEVSSTTRLQSESFKGIWPVSGERERERETPAPAPSFTRIRTRTHARFPALFSIGSWRHTGRSAPSTALAIRARVHSQVDAPVAASILC